ncbi:hypothetical protein F511_35666 [Dorcoceras hygrometricum]|uniref:Uncharacterized protein n=1 Tax=Dorcoceras hygrometricum TaxID=472368 RepID=A0A2Z7D5P1_9LAMI|nr:hypothetical protein F511_35666 [Dorcoceras hygrometricum]
MVQVRQSWGRQAAGTEPAVVIVFINGRYFTFRAILEVFVFLRFVQVLDSVVVLRPVVAREAAAKLTWISDVGVLVARINRQRYRTLKRRCFGEEEPAGGLLARFLVATSRWVKLRQFWNSAVAMPAGWVFSDVDWFCRWSYSCCCQLPLAVVPGLMHSICILFLLFTAVL